MATPTRTGTRVPSLRRYSFSRGGDRPARASSSAMSAVTCRYSGGVRRAQADRARVEVLPREAEHRQEGVVGLDDVARAVGHDDPDEAHLGQAREARLADPEGVARPLLRGLARVQRRLGLLARDARRVLAHLALDGGHEALQAVLEDVVVGAGPHRLDGDGLAHGARDDDEGDVDAEALDERERVERAEPGHRPVADDDVPGRPLERAAHRLAFLHALVLHLAAPAAQLPEDQLGVARGVFDEEHPQGRRHGAAPGTRSCSCARLAPATARRPGTCVPSDSP